MLVAECCRIAMPEAPAGSARWQTEPQRQVGGRLLVTLKLDALTTVLYYSRDKMNRLVDGSAQCSTVPQALVSFSVNVPHHF